MDDVDAVSDVAFHTAASDDYRAPVDDGTLPLDTVESYALHPFPFPLPFVDDVVVEEWVEPEWAALDGDPFDVADDGDGVEGVVGVEASVGIADCCGELVVVAVVVVIVVAVVTVVVVAIVVVVVAVAGACVVVVSLMTGMVVNLVDGVVQRAASSPAPSAHPSISPVTSPSPAYSVVLVPIVTHKISVVPAYFLAASQTQ